MEQNQSYREITQQSIGLQPIYQKVQQLKNVKEIQKKKLQGTLTRMSIQPVNKLDLLLGIDRKQQFFKKRMTHTGNFYGPSTTTDKFKTTKFQYDEKRKSTGQLNVKLLKKTSKSERLINFLKATNKNDGIVKKKVQVPENKADEEDKSIFTPLRPISRNTRSQISSRSKSLRISQGKMSQKLRLQSNTKLGGNSPKKYMRKGYRMRQALVKQLKDDDEIDEESQLGYLKEYDQWVPKFLITHKKLQLEHFMSILKGQKVKGKERKQLLQPMYL